MSFNRSISFFVYLFFVFWVVACNQSPRSTTPTEPSSLSGEELARQSCTGCHAFPSPELLEKDIWKRKVLPQMALRMGFSADSLSPFRQLSDPDEIQRVLQSTAFANAPMVHPDDWQKITDYYVKNAPEKPLPQAPRPAISYDLPLFKIRKPAQPVDNLVTLLAYQPVSRRIAVGSRRGRLYFLDNTLQKVDSVVTFSPPSSLRTRPDGSLDVLAMGTMDPNDLVNGELLHIDRNPATQKIDRTVLLKRLQRPVDATYADLNGDGKEDILVSQFGFYTGQLTWFENTGSTYTEHVLEPVPGAIRTVVTDMNGDGKADIVVLLSQSDEQVAVFNNEGGGRFWKKTVLRFPPVFGSSYLDVVDFDKDGDMDLLYTNGDNADYSNTLKRYHGVRLFRNDGNFKFRQVWFYPLHGATKALARDFDGDGDLDVAAIAFFPDVSRKRLENFVFLENRGNNRFRPKSFPDADQGAWLTMDAADVDQDGDEDLLLGSFAFRVTPTPKALLDRWRQSKAGVILLENQSKTKQQID
ncbi:FG-GAP repeat domain-containing protein [Larkinella punicea]|uniref:VCBS repeat-containing protein n=1 Tax=Larkinella punicea TaxID=2315727 RepID=A0A368JQI3_9BACT|nr:VCBS repeat-containing protein [Larkinella punicea]RCR68431.1 VCBS repeat-containing protein [Larkinella punicea]